MVQEEKMQEERKKYRMEWMPEKKMKRRKG